MNTITSIADVKNLNIEMEQKMGGDFRLVINSPSGRTAILCDDSANEDYYDEESAGWSFKEYINENGGLEVFGTISKALDECWDGYRSGISIEGNYDNAKEYLNTLNED